MDTTKGNSNTNERRHLKIGECCDYIAKKGNHEIIIAITIVINKLCLFSNNNHNE